jgi:prevent-host-death family protein
MKMVSTAELKAHANQLLGFVRNGNRPIVITRHGKPCAVIEPFTEDDLEGLAFEYGPEVLRMARESARDIAANRHVTMDQFARKHGVR